MSLSLTFDQCWASDWWEFWGRGQANEASNGSTLDTNLLSPLGECSDLGTANTRPTLGLGLLGRLGRPGFCWVRTIFEGHGEGTAGVSAVRSVKQPDCWNKANRLLWETVFSMESKRLLFLFHLCYVYSPAVTVYTCYSTVVLNLRIWKRSCFLGLGILSTSQIWWLDLATCSWISIFTRAT